MDLGLHGTVVKRYWRLVLAGIVLGLVLAVLSYAKPAWDGIVPSLEPRASELWESSSTLLLTRSGFPEGQVSPRVDPGRFYQLADVYARVATSDAVMRILKQSGPVNGTVTAFNPATSASGPSPVITLLTRAPTPGEATNLARRASEAFNKYLGQRQRAAQIPEAQRVRVQALRNAEPPTLVEPRKKTIAIVVLLAVLSATFALIYALESFRRGREATRLTAVPAGDAQPAAKPELERRVENARVVGSDAGRSGEPDPVSEPVTSRRWA